MTRLNFNSQIISEIRHCYVSIAKIICTHANEKKPMTRNEVQDAESARFSERVVAGKRHSMTLPRASRVTRSALPVKSQRASKSGSGASRRAEQKSSAYRSSDNEATSTVHAHTRMHMSARAFPRACHVYYRLRRGIARVHSVRSLRFFPRFRFPGNRKVRENRSAAFVSGTAERRRETRVSRRSGFMCTPVHHDHPRIVTHTHISTHAHTRADVCVHTHRAYATHCAISTCAMSAL